MVTRATLRWRRWRGCKAVAFARWCRTRTRADAARMCPRPDQQVLRRANRATRSASGKALLRRRGEYVERAFAHVLDQGGWRRATLKGCENLSKRYLMGALSFNLSLLLRSLFGIGTAKQWLAAPRRAVFVLISSFETCKERLTIFLRCLSVELAFGDRNEPHPQADSQIPPARLTT